LQEYGYLPLRLLGQSLKSVAVINTPSIKFGMDVAYLPHVCSDTLATRQVTVTTRDVSQLDAQIFEKLLIGSLGYRQTWWRISHAGRAV